MKIQTIRRKLKTEGREDLKVWDSPFGPLIVSDGHDGYVLYSWDEWEAGDTADYEADNEGTIYCLGEVVVGEELPKRFR